MKKITIVEDNPDNLLFFKAMLEDLYGVTTFLPTRRMPRFWDMRARMLFSRWAPYCRSYFRLSVHG